MNVFQIVPGFDKTLRICRPITRDPIRSLGSRYLSAAAAGAT